MTSTPLDDETVTENVFALIAVMKDGRVYQLTDYEVRGAKWRLVSNPRPALIEMMDQLNVPEVETRQPYEGLLDPGTFN